MLSEIGVCVSKSSERREPIDTHFGWEIADALRVPFALSTEFDNAALGKRLRLNSTRATFC